VSVTTIKKPQRRIFTRKNGLPRRCPRWCLGQHQDALEEGCAVEDARMHLSEDIGHGLTNLSNAYTGRLIRKGGPGWRVVLHQDHSEDGPGTALIQVEFHARDEKAADQPAYNYITLPMIPSEARSFAAALLHLADTEELHHYR
jgi:hypothetical protein